MRDESSPFELVDSLFHSVGRQSGEAAEVLVNFSRLGLGRRPFNVWFFIFSSGSLIFNAFGFIFYQQMFSHHLGSLSSSLCMLRFACFGLCEIIILLIVFFFECLEQQLSQQSAGIVAANAHHARSEQLLSD